MLLRCSVRTFRHLQSRKPGSRYSRVRRTLLRVALKMVMGILRINDEFIIHNLQS